MQSIDISDTLAKVPVVATGCVFVDREVLETARKWFKDKKDGIIKHSEVID